MKFSLRVAKGFLNHLSLAAWRVAARRKFDEFTSTYPGSIVIMAVQTERSCWGIARVSIGVFLVAIVLVYLFGGFEPSVAVAVR